MKNETDTELLARLMKEGFGEMNKRFDGIDDRFDGIDSRLNGMDNRFDALDVRLDEMGGDITSLQKGQAETHRRLDSIEKKQAGMLVSLDETVHQNEFRKLVGRVEVLETSAK